MGLSWSCRGRFYGLEPHHGLAECLAERLPLGIRQRRFPRFADRRSLLARVGRRRVLDQRVYDRQEIPLAAPVRLAVALDEARALGDLAGEPPIAPRRLGDVAEPALD